MKKSLRVITSIIAVIAILVSCFAVSTFAADNTVKKYDVYTCIGDSNSAGHGLSDWSKNRVPVKGAYHSIIRDAYGCELRPFGSGGYRSHEIRYMLDDEYEMNWDYALICQGTVDKAALDEYKADYVQAVKDADLLTIEVGSNDIFGDALGFAMMDTLYGTIPEFEQLKEMFASNEQLLNIINQVDQVVKYVKFVQEFVVNGTQLVKEFKENWEVIIEKIYELNPGVELVAITAIDGFNNVTLLEDSIKLDWFFDLFMDQINNFIKCGSKYAGTYKYCDIEDMTFGKLSLSQPDFWSVYLPAVHPTAEQHAIIAGRILDLVK